MLQKARERKIAEQRQQKRRDRDLQRKKEYVKQCRSQIEERRLQASRFQNFHPILK